MQYMGLGLGCFRGWTAPPPLLRVRSYERYHESSDIMDLREALDAASSLLSRLRSSTSSSSDAALTLTASASTSSPRVLQTRATNAAR